jgi:hypothetical protein
MTEKIQPEINSNNRDVATEFKLFKKIEDTIEGCIDFVVRFIRTSYTLLIKPQDVLESNSQAKPSIFSRPFTYLAVSVFLSGVMLRGFGNIVWLRVMRRINIEMPTISEELFEITLTSMFQTILPTVSFVLITGAIFGLIVRKRYGRAEGLQTICYTAGFQFILEGILFLVILVSVMIKPYIVFDFSFSKFFDIFKNTIGILFFLYILIGPAYVLFKFIEICKKKQANFSNCNRTTVQKIKLFTAMATLSVGLLFGGYVASATPFLITIQKLYPHLNSLEEKIVLTPVEQKMSSNGNLTMTFTVENLDDKILILKQTGAQLNAKFRIITNSDPEYLGIFNLSKVSLKVNKWDGGESPVLIVEPTATRWLQVMADISKEVDMRVINAKEINAEFHISLETTGSPISVAFSDNTILITDE